MLSSSFKLSLAVATTLMDLYVVGRYAGVLWSIWGPSPLERVGLLALAGGITFTLMDIWSQTIFSLMPRIVSLNKTGRSRLILGQSAGMESADV